MAQFKTRAFTVDAIKVTGALLDNKAAWPDWLKAAWPEAYASPRPSDMLRRGYLTFTVGEALFVLKEGDMAVCQDGDGEIYMMRPDVFPTIFSAV